MGNINSKEQKLFYAIQEENEALVKKMLDQDPELANA